MQWKVDTREVEQKLLKAAKIYGADAVENITEGAAKIVKEESKRRAPYRTGRLRNSHIVKRLDRRMGRPAPHIAGIDRAKAPHGWLMEFGQHKRPYFRPAVEAKRGEVARHLENGLRRLVEGFR